MSVYEQLVQGQTKLSLIGLGYVGMPIAVEFSKHVQVVGYDINSRKINQYENGIDVTNEVGSEALRECKVEFCPLAPSR